MFDASPRPELLALLRAVKAEPDEDTPKLALADWLQEQPHPADQARGEFLRTSVQRDRLEHDRRAWVSHDLRVQELWQEHRHTWAGSLIATGFQFWGEFVRYGLLFPSIDGTRLTAKTTAIVACTEAYAWIGGLSFNRLSNRQLGLFAESPLLDPLISIQVQDCNVYPSAVAELVYSPRVAGLKYLDLGKIVTAPGAIAASPHLAGLRKLQLWNAQLADAGFKLLCNSPHLNSLRSLVVTNNSLTIHSARAFADGTGLPALTELDLGGSNQIGPDGTLILITSPKAGRLRKLNLWSNDVGDYGTEAICKQTHLDNLTHLDLAGNLITNRGAAALAATDQLKNLQELILKTNAISGDGALALANSPTLGRVRRLDVSGNRIGQKAAAALRERFGQRVIVD